MHPCIEWYTTTYPNHGLTDVQLGCLPVLAAWQPLYNILPARRYTDDGGFQPWGTGICVLVKTSLATYDFAELTRLVLAAHQYHCRVEIAPAMKWLRIIVHQRSAEGQGWEYHPGLDALARGAEALAVSA